MARIKGFFRYQTLKFLVRWRILVGLYSVWLCSRVKAESSEGRFGGLCARVNAR